ncbi:hypothetical protein Vadar_012234 [Vaccinium darrowii]|uniref:Uncharacterized protein n=1 Tax=Vaccinium darrowii TaxID=229202 RepID=A0ACB7ZBN2_9ERIC|nr:hypothetical protein Vadar_012234 [Vaccinium darrowii]
MDWSSCVLDVSSDDGGDDDDFDWVSEILEEAERKRIDDSDDVVGVLNSSLDDDDDDCVVLDGDPEEPHVIENNAGGESDDLLVVGEKGQIACRDYPHSRHLCANFPFISTPHERHCNQCHCFVCDTLAPCVHWGNGTSSIDHCHGNDKDEFWISQRQHFKQGDKAPVLPVHKLLDTSLFALPQQNQCPPLTELPRNPGAHNQTFRPTTIRACSASTNFGIPNITNQGRGQQYASILSGNKFQPHLVAQHLLSAGKDFIQRNRRHNSGNVGPHVINSPRLFKRAGSRVASATYQTGYPSFHKDLLTQYWGTASGAAASNDKNPPRWQDIPNRKSSIPNAYRPSSHPNVGSVCVNSVPSQTQVYSQPIPALNDWQVGLQQVNGDFSALHPSFSDVVTSSIPPGHSNKKYLPDKSQVQSAEFDPQIPVNTNPGSLDFLTDGWMLENQSALGALEKFLLD